MKLQTVGMITVSDGLDRADLRLRQYANAFCHSGYLSPMPLQNRHWVQDTCEQWIGSTRVRQSDRQNANFALPRRPDGAAQRGGEQLMPETNAEIRTAHLDDICSYGFYLCTEPWILICLPYVLRATHDEHGIEPVERWNFAAFVEFGRLPGDAVGPHEVAEDARVFGNEVLKNEDMHVISAAVREALTCRSKQSHSSPNYSQPAAFQCTLCSEPCKP